LDNLAHTLFGVHLSRLPAFRPLPPRLAFWTGVVASNLPDADGVLRFVSRETWIFEHRGITHSIVGALAMAPLLAWAAAALARRPLPQVIAPLLGLSLAGLAGHVLLDYLTAWGTMVLLPFSHDRLSLPWLFVIDPIVWLILGLPLARTAWRRHRGALPDRILRRSSVVALTAFSVYVAASGAARERARGAALAQLPDGAGRPVEVLAYPSPPGPLLWTTLVRTEDQVWHRGFASVITGGVTWVGAMPTGVEDPRVQVALETEVGATYRWFADALYRVEASPLRADGSYEVVLGDLRFTGPFREEVPFQLHLEIGPDFRVRRWSFRTGHLSPDPPEEETPATAGGPT